MCLMALIGVSLGEFRGNAFRPMQNVADLIYIAPVNNCATEVHASIFAARWWSLAKVGIVARSGQTRLGVFASASVSDVPIADVQHRVLIDSLITI